MGRLLVRILSTNVSIEGTTSEFLMVHSDFDKEDV